MRLNFFITDNDLVNTVLSSRVKVTESLQEFKIFITILNQMKNIAGTCSALA